MNGFGDILKQAQAAQEKVKQAQEELGKLEIHGEAGAGMVKITINGNGDALKIDIDDAVYSEDKQILQGLIVAAMNDANKKRDRVKSEKMKSFMQGMGLPEGFNFEL